MGFREPGYSLNYFQAFPLDAEGKDNHTRAIAHTLMRAALQGFGNYVFLPFEVDRHTSGPAG